MSQAAVDRALAALVLAMAGTGLWTLRAGHPSDAWVYTAHALLAGALAAAVVLKLRASVPRAVAARRWGRLALGLLVTLAVAAALSGGWLWVAGGELLSVGAWTVLTLHAWVGLALVPLVVVHLLPRRWRLLRPRPRRRAAGAGVRLSRRALLIGGAFAVAGLGATGAVAGLERLRGGERRFTGSRWLPAGGVPPPTTFFGEPAPPIDPAAWRLSVIGPDGMAIATLTIDELRALGQVEQRAVLDCTSGWALDTAWRGVPVGTVLGAVGADGIGDVTVRSATGWATVLPLVEARSCLLATEVAGAALPTGNGAPVRLVAPDRRGLDWVKWVTRLELA